MSATSEPWIADLRAVLDRIIPKDDYASATEAGVDRFILDLWRGGSEPSEALVRDGLSTMAGFAHLPADEQDRQLGTRADCRWFRYLCELAAEGFYADPGNGANPDAVSWQMIGYRPGLPAGPSGPPSDPRDAVQGRLRA
jgi:hypothetical protein